MFAIALYAGLCLPAVVVRHDPSWGQPARLVLWQCVEIHKPTPELVVHALTAADAACRAASIWDRYAPADRSRHDVTVVGGDGQSEETHAVVGRRDRDGWHYAARGLE